jgi:tetratricopeptide (TPR) repeat protein
MSHKLIKKEEGMKYDKIVAEYLRHKGSFLLVTNDDMFVKTVRGAMRVMSISYDSLAVFQRAVDVEGKCREMFNRNTHIVMFIEVKIDGKSNVYAFKSLKETYNDKLKIICLTPEVSEAQASLIAESEVDSIIVKPISINNLIQKVAFAIRPSNPFSTEIERIKGLIDKRAFSEAMAGIESLLGEKPDSSICLMLKGDIFRMRDDYNNAEHYYKEASRSARLSLKPLQRLVDLYRERGDSENCIKHLLLMNRISPLNHKRKIDIGTEYNRIGQEDLARQYYDVAIGIVKSQAGDMLSSALMDIGMRMREFSSDQGVDFMRQALDVKGSGLTRDDLWMVNEMGMSLRKNGDWQGAVETYRQVLDLIPDEGGLYYNLGMAYFQGKAHRKAIEQFETAVSVSPEILRQTPLIPFNIGMVHYRMKRYEDARRYMLAALDIDPDYSQAKDMLARLEKESGKA